MPKFSEYTAATALTDDDLFLVTDSPGSGPSSKKLTALILKSYVADGVVASSTQTASYTLALSDAGKVVVMNVAAGNTLTVPPNSDVAFPVGTVVGWEQVGVGQTAVTAGAGVTIRSRGGLLASAGQYASGSLRKLSTNEWILAGDVV